MIRDSTGYRRIVGALEPLRPVYDAWMAVISAFSWVLVRVLLTATFFTAFVVYSIGLRIFGHDPMRRDIDSDRESYWRESVIKNDELEDYKGLF